MRTSRRVVRSCAPLVVLLSACTSAPPTPNPATSELADQLREGMRLPALPSFTLPTDVLTGGNGQDIARRLGVVPGLYRDIAVLDARCGEAGDVSAADATVSADGTGVYDGPGLHIAVLGDGTGVYEDEQVRLTVQAGGAGTYVDDERRSFVRADGSGSFRDADSRLWVEADGSGGYDGPEGRATVDAQGVTSGDPALAEAVTTLAREGLPRFPPVPLIRRAQPVGQQCGTVVRLDAGVLFAVDSADLRPDAGALLDRVARLLGELDHPAAQVVGHTDSTGAPAYNQTLSERRAQAVADRLVAGGVPAGSLEALGRGEDVPVAPDAGDPAAQQLNRRVEVVLRD